MTLIDLPSGVLGALRAHVTAAYPREACGVVLERGGRFEAIACRNIHPVPSHHFRVGLRDRLAIALRLKSGERLTAIYHSHCDEPAIFSEEDGAFAAAWPDALHLVFAVTAQGVIAQHAYDAQGTRVDEPVLESA